jgi:pyroglutamyl-peptidase
VILLSAFEAFGDDSTNSSADVVTSVVRDLASDLVSLVILPVSYQRSVTSLLESINSVQPSVVVCFGQAAGRERITVETQALNARGSAPDNDGDASDDSVIVAGGPASYPTTLPVARLLGAALSTGVGAETSLSAGDFVCNYLFYRLQASTLSAERHCGFVHLPITESQLDVHPDSAFMTLNNQRRAVRAMIESLLRT